MSRIHGLFSRISRRFCSDRAYCLAVGLTFPVALLAQLSPGDAAADSSQTLGGQYASVSAQAQAASAQEQAIINLDNGNIAGFQAGIATLSQQIDDANQQIARKQAQITQLQQEAAAASMGNPLGGATFQFQIKLNEADIQELNSQIDDYKGQIATYQENINNAQDDIAQRTEAIAQQDSTSGMADQAVNQLTQAQGAGGMAFSPGPGGSQAQAPAQGSVQLASAQVPDPGGGGGQPAPQGGVQLGAWNSSNGGGGDGTFAGPANIVKSNAGSLTTGVLEQATQGTAIETGSGWVSPGVNGVASLLAGDPVGAVQAGSTATATATAAEGALSMVDGVPGAAAIMTVVPTNNTDINNPAWYTDNSAVGARVVQSAVQSYPDDPTLQQLQGQLQALGPVAPYGPNWNQYLGIVQQTQAEVANQEAQTLQASQQQLSDMLAAGSALY